MTSPGTYRPESVEFKLLDEVLEACTLSVYPPGLSVSAVASQLSPAARLRELPCVESGNYCRILQRPEQVAALDRPSRVAPHASSPDSIHADQDSSVDGARKAIVIGSSCLVRRSGTFALSNSTLNLSKSHSVIFDSLCLNSPSRAIETNMPHGGLSGAHRKTTPWRVQVRLDPGRRVWRQTLLVHWLGRHPWSTGL